MLNNVLEKIIEMIDQGLDTAVELPDVDQKIATLSVLISNIAGICDGALEMEKKDDSIQ